MGFFLYNGLCPEKVAEKGRIPVLGDNRTSWRTVHPRIQKGAIANVQSKRGNTTQGPGSRSQLPGLALEMAGIERAEYRGSRRRPDQRMAPKRNVNSANWWTKDPQFGAFGRSAYFLYS